MKPGQLAIVNAGFSYRGSYHAGVIEKVTPKTVMLAKTLGLYNRRWLQSSVIAVVDTQEEADKLCAQLQSADDLYQSKRRNIRKEADERLAAASDVHDKRVQRILKEIGDSGNVASED